MPSGRAEAGFCGSHQKEDYTAYVVKYEEETAAVDFPTAAGLSFALRWTRP